MRPSFISSLRFDFPIPKAFAASKRLKSLISGSMLFSLNVFSGAPRKVQVDLREVNFLKKRGDFT